MKESINGLEEHLQQLTIPTRDEGPSQEAYERTRAELVDLLNEIGEMIPEREDLRGQLREHATILFEPVRLFVAGEFSKGKSYLINVLCSNETVRETNIGPQDTKITVLAHGDARDNTSSRHVDRKHHPFPFLKLLNLVDSPGINAALRPEHTEITQKHVASADLILFVTSAERTVSQEEIDLIRFIAEHNKSEVVFIVNKIDVFEDSLIHFVDQTGKTDVIRFLEQTLVSQTHLRDPLIFSVSTRRAMWALSHRDESISAEVWKRSGVGALINHIGHILQSGEAAILKLRSRLNYLDGEHIDGLPILQGLSERVNRLITDLDQSRGTIQRVETDISLKIGEIHGAINDFKFDEIERELEKSIDDFVKKFLSEESFRALDGMAKEEQEKHVQREFSETFAPWEQGVEAKKLAYVENILQQFERCWTHAHQTLEANDRLHALVEERELREGKTMEEAFEFERQNSELLKRFETHKRGIREGSQTDFEKQAHDTQIAIEANKTVFGILTTSGVLAIAGGVLVAATGGLALLPALLVAGGGSVAAGANRFGTKREKRIREHLRESFHLELEEFRTEFNETIRSVFDEEADAFKVRCERIFVQNQREIVDEKMAQTQAESEKIKSLISRAGRLKSEVNDLRQLLGLASTGLS